MGTNECSQPASKSSWDSQHFGDVSMVLKMVHFRKSTRPQWVNTVDCHNDNIWYHQGRHNRYHDKIKSVYDEKNLLNVAHAPIVIMILFRVI